jgi:DnaJ-class molecular chaperone
MDNQKIIKSLNLLAIPLDVDFTEEDINRNFRALANLYHPDKHKINDNGET